MSGNYWIGVDFDGVLAEHESSDGHLTLGKPIPAMVNRVRAWLAEGRQVRVLTARVASIYHDAEAQRLAIALWLVTHVGSPESASIRITSEKDGGMIELWDDRCVRVEKNTGRRLSDSHVAGSEISKLIEHATEILRGCTCDYDYRCGNCELILEMKDVIGKL